MGNSVPCTDPDLFLLFIQFPIVVYDILNTSDDGQLKEIKR